MHFRPTALFLGVVLVGGLAVAAPAPSRPNPKEQAVAEDLKNAGFEIERIKGDPCLRVTGVRWFRVRGAPPLTTTDLASLQELPYLRELSLSSHVGEFLVDKEAARQLARLRGLKYLKASWLQFQPGTLTIVAAGLPELELIDLSYCGFPRGDLDALGKIPKVRFLNLVGDNITDDDLERFGKPGAFPNLETLVLMKCKKLTAKGVAALRKARPKLDIVDD